MPISDSPITFTLAGEPYSYEEYDEKKQQFVEVKGTFGDEYQGAFKCRHRSVKDRKDINNAMALRYPMVNYRTGQVPPTDIDNDLALITLQTVKIGDDGVPDWFDEEKLGTDLDQVALRAALRIYQERLNDRVKASGADS